MPSLVFPHWQFLSGVILLIAHVLITRWIWGVGRTQVQKHQWRTYVIYGNRFGLLLWLTALAGFATALITGLIGGTPWTTISASSRLGNPFPSLGTIAALTLLAVLFGLVFPLMAHRMHGYSGHASRLVLHITRFFTLETFCYWLVFYVIGVHIRTGFCAQFVGTHTIGLLYNLSDYNLVDAAALIMFIGLVCYQFHSFIKRCIDQLGTVELVIRASNVVMDIISWNTRTDYKPIQLKCDDRAYRDRRRALPGIVMNNEDELQFALLVCDIGAVARKSVLAGDLHATLKAIEALTAIVRAIQEKQADLDLNKGLVFSTASERANESESRSKTLIYVQSRNLIIEHVIREVDQVVTVATTESQTHILTEILQKYEQLIEDAIAEASRPHEADWCFDVLARTRRFFYLQITYNNPWLARRTLDMVLNIAECTVGTWAKHGMRVDSDELRFYDRCLSFILSSLRKAISYSTINNESSVCRVALSHCLAILAHILMRDSRHAGRSAGSIVRTLLSAAMFSLERSQFVCFEIALDVIVQVSRAHDKFVTREITEIVTQACPSESSGSTPSLQQVMEWQLTDEVNPKLDLDKEDLMVNRDSLVSCAAAVIELAECYGVVTARDVTLPRGLLTGVNPIEVQAWMQRAKELGTPLVKAAVLHGETRRKKQGRKQ